jgi:hypothetical protein
MSGPENGRAGKGMRSNRNSVRTHKKRKDHELCTFYTHLTKGSKYKEIDFDSFGSIWKELRKKGRKENYIQD